MRQRLALADTRQYLIFVITSSTNSQHGAAGDHPSKASCGSGDERKARWVKTDTYELPSRAVALVISCLQQTSATQANNKHILF
jgi:hypothetical protein